MGRLHEFPQPTCPREAPPIPQPPLPRCPLAAAGIEGGRGNLRTDPTRVRPPGRRALHHAGGG